MNLWHSLKVTAPALGAPAFYEQRHLTVKGMERWEIPVKTLEQAEAVVGEMLESGAHPWEPQQLL